MQAETRVTRPPEAVLIRASSTVFWKASKVRNRDLPITVKEGGRTANVAVAKVPVRRGGGDQAVGTTIFQISAADLNVAKVIHSSGRFTKHKNSVIVDMLLK